MKMLRHYYISDNLDDLEVFEEQLEGAGVSTPQIHVLSHDDAEVAKHHHLHDVNSLMKQDSVHSATVGAVCGAIFSSLVLSIAYFAGWTATAAGWIPFIFLAIVLLGFCTWEGGFIGIQEPNHHFRRFKDALSAGKHIFFVDLKPSQETILTKLLKSHPQLQAAGTGKSTPHWFLEWQKRVPQFLKQTWP